MTLLRSKPCLATLLTPLGGRRQRRQGALSRAARAGAAALALACPWALAQDPNLARNLAATCANCHGTNGHSQGEVKALAGMAAGRIVSAFNDYKTGVVPATVMHQIAKGYSDEQIKLIAAYLAAQPARK